MLIIVTNYRMLAMARGRSLGPNVRVSSLTLGSRYMCFVRSAFVLSVFWRSLFVHSWRSSRQLLSAGLQFNRTETSPVIFINFAADVDLGCVDADLHTGISFVCGLFLVWRGC